MKLPLEIHKQQIREIQKILKKDREWQEERLLRRQKELDFYIAQYKRAKLAGLKSFDRNTF